MNVRSAAASSPGASSARGSARNPRTRGSRRPEVPTSIAQFLPPERDVLHAPENERRLVREGGAVLPDRAQPVARAHDVARQRGARGPCWGRRLCTAVVSHDLRRQGAPVADRFRHHSVHEDVVMPQQVLADPARHQEAERLEVEVVSDRPAPGVRDDETLDALRVLACEVEADRPTPVGHEQGDLAKVEMVEQSGQAVRVTLGTMVLAPCAP